MNVPALLDRYPRRWLVAAASLIVLLVAGGVAFCLLHDTSYSQHDLSAATANVSAIKKEFAKIDSLTPAQTASDNLKNNSSTLTSYQVINSQIKTLSKSPALHNAAVHTAFNSLNTTWQQKYTLTKDDLNYLRIVDTYDNSPAFSGGHAADNAAALKIYQARVDATRTAEQSLNAFLSSQPDVTQAKADFSTYLRSTLSTFTTIVDSLQQGKDLATNAPVDDKSALASQLTQETDSVLSTTVNTYLTAANTDYARINADLKKLNMQTPITNLTKALATAKPTK